MQGFLVRQEEEGWVGEELGFGFGVPVRMLGSSRGDIGELVVRGELRRDFGERMWVERVRLEALRERLGEVGGIVREVLRERGIGKRVSIGAVEELLGYEWPGNVEELEGLVVRTGLRVKGEEIGEGDWAWGFGVERRVLERGGGEEGEGDGVREDGGIGRGEGVGAGEGLEGDWGGRGVGGEEVLLSTLVHEVKNPLVAISTFAHLLPERYGEEEFRGEFSRLVGLEVKRLNGVLEMLLEYGQLGTPRPDRFEFSKWLKIYGDEKKRSLTQKISVEFRGETPVIQFDERHFNFIMERIFEDVQSRGISGGEVRIACIEATSGEKKGKIEIAYDEQDSFAPPRSKKGQNLEEGAFEGLSLGMGLARRIMRKNNGEMIVLQGQEGQTMVLLLFPVGA
jgi:hypothetical protein